MSWCRDRDHVIYPVTLQNIAGIYLFSENDDVKQFYLISHPQIWNLKTSFARNDGVKNTLGAAMFLCKIFRSYTFTLVFFSFVQAV